MRWIALFRIQPGQRPRGTFLSSALKNIMVSSSGPSTAPTPTPNPGCRTNNWTAPFRGRPVGERGESEFGDAFVASSTDNAFPHAPFQLLSKKASIG